MSTTEERLMLEMMANMVECVLGVHRKPCRVLGGTLGPQVIRLHLKLAPHIRVADVERLADDLALGLHVPDVRVERSEEGVRLEFVNPHPRPIGFRSMMETDAVYPARSMLLGMSPDGTAQFVKVGSSMAAHVLVSGTTGCGKSVLLRVLMLSLMLKNSPAAVRLMVFDPKRRLLPEGFAAPHLSRAVSTEGEIEGGLRDLVHTMEGRDRRRETFPHIVAVIDELADIVMTCEGAAAQIGRLVQRGRESGVHLVAATQHPSAAILGGVMRANFPLRLVGRVVSADDAKVAAGQPGTHAERLGAHGDFIAVYGGERTRFQVPLVTVETMGTIGQEIPRSTVEAVIEVSPAVVEIEPEDAGAVTLREDVAALMARARQEGRMPMSKREAERWLFDENRGGAFWNRTEKALQEAYAEGFDLTEPREPGIVLPLLVSKFRAVAG